jgi:glycine betaine/proline transport system permease protein
VTAVDGSATIASAAADLLDRQQRAGRRRLGWYLLAVAAAGALIVATSSLDTFPTNWNLGMAEPLNEARRWLVANQNGHWLYTFVLNPITATIELALTLIEGLLRAVPFWVVLALTALAFAAVTSRRGAVLAVVGVAHAGAVGVWDEYVDTLALTAAAVILAVGIGIPIGVLAANHRRFRRLLEPVLDLMQTLPAFVYLIPFALLFSIGLVPSVLSTVIFALPPVIRLTDTGIREVETAAVEASRMFGATERQTLLKVRIPLARPAILAGVNQTILLAVSMVVIAGFIGAGGLGQVVLRSLRDLDVGRATEAGLTIVIMAIILDRFGHGVAQLGRVPRPRWERLAGVGAAVAVGWIVCAAAGWTEPPSWLDLSYRGAVNGFVAWARDNLFDIGGSGIGTGPFSDFLTIRFVTPLREVLSVGVSWLALQAIAVAVAWRGGGPRVAVVVGGCLFGVGLLGMWELAMDTLAQVVVALGLCLLVGVPLGIAAARSRRVERLLRPVLDLFQTIPSFVLLVPVLLLFNVGRIPGIIASVLYAAPATIRLVTLALRSVPESMVEAGIVFGGTRWQNLRKIELPAARPLLLTALNQTVMLVLSMVVISGLVGGGGLGLETVRGLRRTDSVGTGIEAGQAIVLLAIAIDRLLAAYGQGDRSTS